MFNRGIIEKSSRQEILSGIKDLTIIANKYEEIVGFELIKEIATKNDFKITDEEINDILNSSLYSSNYKLRTEKIKELQAQNRELTEIVNKFLEGYRFFKGLNLVNNPPVPKYIEPLMVLSVKQEVIDQAEKLLAKCEGVE